jgi:AmiR/NasT family two-component response regulator
MAESRCDPEEAFSMLRRASNNRNLKLHDVATEIVSRFR